MNECLRDLLIDIAGPNVYRRSVCCLGLRFSLASKGLRGELGGRGSCWASGTFPVGRGGILDGLAC